MTRRTIEQIKARAEKLGINENINEVEEDDYDEATEQGLIPEDEEMFANIITDLLKIQIKLNMRHSLSDIVNRMVELNLLDADSYVAMTMALEWFASNPNKYFEMIKH